MIHRGSSLRRPGLPRTLGGALAAGLLLAACSAGVPSAAPPGASSAAPSEVAAESAADTAAPVAPLITFEDLITLGEELTAALNSGDVEQWMALTELQGVAAQQQRDWFAGVHAVPMELREMHPVFLVRTNDGDGGATVHYAFRHQITGVDPVPVLESYEVTLAAVAGDWRITQVTGAPTDHSSYPQEWDEGPVTVVEGEHTVLVAAADARLTPELAQSLDESVGEVLAALGGQDAHRLLVEFSDATSINTFYGRPDATSSVDWFYYFPHASPDVELTGRLPDVEEGEFSVPRLKLDGRQIQQERDIVGPVLGGSLIAREGAMTALLLQEQPLVESPAWVMEGLPTWFAAIGDPTAREVMHAAVASRLTDVEQVTAFPSASYHAYYAGDSLHHQSVLVFWYLEEVYGQEVVFQLARDLLAVSAHAPDAQDQIDALFPKHLGLTRAEAEAQWITWLQEEFGDE